MQSGFNKLNLTGLAMLLLPIIMVKMMALMLGVGLPRNVTASTSSGEIQHMPQIIQQEDARIWSKAQQQAHAYLDEVSDMPFRVNPMLYGGRASQPSIATPSIAQRYTLKMIMSTPNGNIALINNEQYRVGDRIDDTPWRIVAIDGDIREVLVRHTENDLETVLRVD